MLSSIKARLMVVSSSLILLLVGATVITRYLELDAVLQKSLRDSLQKQQGQVLELINLKSEVAAALAEFTANIPSVKELFAARDRQGLSALVMPIYDKLRDKAGLSQMQFATPKTVSFLRLHAPEKFDDDLSTIRPTMVTANREDRPVIGIEVGVAGMGIRAVVPMTLGKEKLGVVEVGMAVNDAMLMPLKNQFGFDVSIVVPEGDGFTFQARTHKMPISPASYPTLKKVMSSGQPEFHRVAKDGKELMTLFMPLKDYSGKVVGVVTIPRDIGPELARLNGDIIRDVLIGLGAMVVILALVYLVIRAYVDKPVKTMITFFETVRQGDYKARLSGTMCGEMALLASGLNELMTTIDQGLEQTRQAEREAADQARRAGEALGESRAKEERMEAMVARMRELAERISGVSGRLAETAEELSERVHETLDGAERQHRRFQDAAASMDEMRATVEEMAKNADSAAEGAETAMDTARAGEGAVSEAVGSIEGVQRKMLALRDKMRDLGVKASDIGRIMSVINDIADQTNLLALNAAIEAARAGDAGRGFAVVADEVRKLAEKTMQATKEVGQAITGIQDVAADNVAATDATTRDIVDATELARRSGNCLTEIVRIVDGSVREAKAIAMATREQSQAAKDISRAVEEVNAVALETASGMESSAEAVRRLGGLAGELTGLVGEYRS